MVKYVHKNTRSTNYGSHRFCEYRRTLGSYASPRRIKTTCQVLLGWYYSYLLYHKVCMPQDEQFGQTKFTDSDNTPMSIPSPSNNNVKIIRRPLWWDYGQIWFPARSRFRIHRSLIRWKGVGPLGRFNYNIDKKAKQKKNRRSAISNKQNNCEESIRIDLQWNPFWRTEYKISGALNTVLDLRSRVGLVPLPFRSPPLYQTQ